MRSRLLPGLLLLAVGCSAPAPRPPEARPPEPSSAPGPASCQQAAALRTKASGLIEQARFFKAGLALRQAGALCPAEERQGWALWLSIYGALEQDDAARGLIAVIRAAEQVPDDARAAAVALDSAIAQRKPRDASGPPTIEFIPDSERAAEQALGKRDFARAAGHFADLFRASQQPHYQVLQGVSLLRAGSKPEGRLAIEQGIARAPWLRPALRSIFGQQGPGVVTPDGTIFLAEQGQLSEYSVASLRERLTHNLQEGDPSQWIGDIVGLEVSPDGRSLAVLGTRGLHLLWQQAAGRPWALVSTQIRGEARSPFGRFHDDSVFVTDEGDLAMLQAGGNGGWSPLTGEQILHRISSPAEDYGEAPQPVVLPQLSRGLLLIARSGLGPPSRRIPTFGLIEPGAITSSLEASPGGKLIAGTTEGAFAVLESGTARRKWVRRDRRQVNRAVFLDEKRLLVELAHPQPISPGDTMVEGVEPLPHDLHVVDAATGKTLVELQQVRLPPRERRFYRLIEGGQTVAQVGGHFFSWDARTGKLQGSSKEGCGLNPATLTSRGGGLCVERDDLKGETLIDASRGERRMVRPRAHHHGALVALSSRAESLAILDTAGALHHFDLSSGKWRAYPPKEEPPPEAPFPPNAHLSLSPRGDVVAWSIPKPRGGTRLFSARAEGVTSIDVHGDNVASLSASSERLLACQREGRPVQVYQLPGLTEAPGFERLPDKNTPTRCALSPDGALFACSDRQGDVALLEAASGRKVASLHANQAVDPDLTGLAPGANPTTQLVFSGDSRVLASAGSHEVHLWSVEQKTLSGVVLMPGFNPWVTLSHDGSRLGATNHATMSLFRAPWGSPAAQLQADARIANFVSSTAFFSGDRLSALSPTGLVSLDERDNARRLVPLASTVGVPRRNAAHAPEAGLVAVSTASGVVLMDEARGEVRATVRLLSHGAGWYAFTPSGLADWGGDDEALGRVLRCSLGAWVVPIEACEDRVRVPGLLGLIAGGKTPSLTAE